nr:DUF4855 domain-containing protein [Sphingobacterium bovistauri]
MVSCSVKEQLPNPSLTSNDSVNTAGKYPVKTNYVSDLVLLYQGGTHRLDYTEEELTPYISLMYQGKRNWLYDGFLFIEFKDNRGSMYAEGYGGKPAGKNEWMWLLARNFEKGKGVSALNNALGKLYKRKEIPKRDRKVVLTLPEPIKDFENWGLADSKKLNFKNNADRIAACKWYIDYVLAVWKKQNFNNVTLDGFYWVAETQKNSDNILFEIGNYIRSKGLKFYWIPYMYALGAETWKEAGFDIAYQQPNYFFKLDRPKTLFAKAIDNSNRYQMGLEMEFDDKITDPEYRKRFYDYIEAFQNAKSWDTKPIAYYEGGGAWLRMFKSTDPEVRKAYDDLVEIIIKRQTKEDLNY